MSISHDSVNRFLNRESYSGRDLYNEASPTLDLKGGTLSVDDSVLDKPYSQYMALVSHFWSGKHHRAVKGINLLTLYYTDSQGKHQPVNFRVVDKAEGKTKNDYFQDMLDEVLAWGLEPAFVTGDSWYSCVSNLKRIKNHQMGLLFALESNRLVSVEKGSWVQVQQLEIPADGLVVWLKNFGQVKLFRTQLKDQLRHYISALPSDEQTTSLIIKPSPNNMTGIGKLSNITVQLSRYVTLSVFKSAVKAPSKIIFLLRFVVLSNYRNSASRRSLTIAIACSGIYSKT